MSISNKFNNLSPKQKRITMAIASVTMVIGVSYVLASMTEKKTNKNPRAEKPEVSVVSPARTTGVESFAAKMAMLEKNQSDMQSRFERLQKENKEGARKPSVDDADLGLDDPIADIDPPPPPLAAGTPVFDLPTSRPPELPPPPAGPPVAPADVVQASAPVEAAAPPVVAEKVIRIIGESGEINTAHVEETLNKPPAPRASAQTADHSAFIPAGSMFTGVLLSGLDAPTSAVAQKNPTPVVIRVKREALLPNYAAIDVRECFLIAAGYGQLSSERALMRAETLSCVRSDGKVIESQIDAYIVGADGKVGIPGRLVSKQGQMIAQSLIAGALGGIGATLGGSKVPALNINPSLGETVYERDSVSSVAQSGIAGGVSSATNMIAKFYLDMAKETFPVVEIPAGEVATIIVTRGATLPLKGSTNLQKFVDESDRKGGQNNAPQRRDSKPVSQTDAAATSAQVSSAIGSARAAASAPIAGAGQTLENGLGWGNTK